MNRLQQMFHTPQKNLLSVFFTAGFPHRDDTVPILRELERSGADLAEIGMPFSDPLADGPVIQHSSHIALQNGMSLRLLMEQLKDVRKVVSMPLLLMGYLNPVLSYGMERFLSDAHACGIDGIILPDLPLEEYESEYQSLFRAYEISNVFLITPQTSEERIRKIDSLTDSFIYMLSTSATTGTKKKGFETHRNYFERIQAMQLGHQILIGFGIRDRLTFLEACRYASGAIVGTAFIEALEKASGLQPAIREIIQSIQGSICSC